MQQNWGVWGPTARDVARVSCRDARKLCCDLATAFAGGPAGGPLSAVVCAVGAESAGELAEAVSRFSGPIGPMAFVAPRGVAPGLVVELALGGVTAAVFQSQEEAVGWAAAEAALAGSTLVRGRWPANWRPARAR
jgi:hypothetical protein